jgi:serine/threonine protein kinase/Tol biopolymer transport system component
MGEIYRAKDTRLNRAVAIKVVVTQVRDDAEFTRRFEREARALAALNHPHACALFDVGHHDGLDFLVMEFLEGQTLADRIKQGALPFNEALSIAIDVADALTAAHRHGIIHRDVKPGNIMLTARGAVLCDFGLAKRPAVAPAGAGFGTIDANGSVSRTGIIVGTPAYMAPEQIEGREVDSRSDIFAFGATVYEAVTGRRPFDGTSQASLTNSIVNHTPHGLRHYQPIAPPALEHIVARCLAKEPDERWQTASDLTRELQWVAKNPIAEGIPLVRRHSLGLGAATAALVAVLAVGVSMYLMMARPQNSPTMRFEISLPEGWRVVGGVEESTPTVPLAVSPDGQHVAVVARNAAGGRLLAVRSLHTMPARLLAGTEGASSPFWSPGSRFLGFFADGKLKKIDILSGSPITLCDAHASTGGTWSRNGVILFSTELSGIQRVSANGGSPEAVTALTDGEIGHSRPSFLPDQKHFLYFAENGGWTGSIYVGSLESSLRKLLLASPDSVNAVYSRGHLLFQRQTALVAQAFDLTRLELLGEPFQIADVAQIGLIGTPAGVFAVAEQGVVAYQPGLGAGSSRLIWFDRSGREVEVVGDGAAFSDLEPSPDRSHAVVSVPERGRSTRDVWVFDLARRVRTRFTLDPVDDIRPEWSHDGTFIVFASNRKGKLDLYRKPFSGSGADEVLLEDDRDKYPQSFSPDGRFLLYAVADSSSGWDLWVLPLFGDRKAYPFMNMPFQEIAGKFSPDGRWIAYLSTESGRPEIYVVPFPGPGRKWQVSTAGGDQPTWHPNGTEIFYLTVNGDSMMSAAVNGKGSTFEVGAVTRLFETRPVQARGRYFPSRDGQRFLINTASDPASSPITVVVNWLPEERVAPN